jgi:serine phosphatase RsbU (regulator of sigma subunit)
VNRVRFSLRGLIVAFGLVALILPVGLVGLFQVIQQLNDINKDVATVRFAQLDAANILRAQIDEENAIRGYAASHEQRELPIFARARSDFDKHAAALKAKRIVDGRDPLVNGRFIDQAIALNTAWRRRLADPILRGSRDMRALYGPGDALIDRFRVVMTDAVEPALVDDYNQLLVARSLEIRNASYIGYGAIVVVGAELIAFALILTRLRYDLDRERTVAEALQRGFTIVTPPNPYLDVATHYLSAMDGARVGGDAYDVFAIDDDRRLIAIADVSGKGANAAIDALFVRNALRAFASEYSDVGTIATRFNALFCASERSSESFVELFVAVYDRRTSTLEYVNAGHEPVYIVRGTEVSSLAATGPIVGIIRDETFVARTRRLAADEIVFLATDGLTEARNARGEFLTDAGVRRWLAEAAAPSPGALVELIVQRLRAYTRKSERDDLAIVAFRIRGTRA